MTFIKSFSQFSEGHLNEDSVMGSANRAVGEIAKWHVKIKTTGGAEVPAGQEGNRALYQVINDLTKNQEFVKWWTGLSDIATSVTQYNYQLIPFYDLSKDKQSASGKEKIKADIVFKVFLNPRDYGDNFNYMMYDLSKGQPLMKDVQVGSSPYKLAVWSMNNESAMKFVQTDPTQDKGIRVNRPTSGVNTPNNLIGKASSGQMPPITGAQAPASASSTSGTAGTAGQATQTTGKIKCDPTGYMGLRWDGGKAVVQKVADLQSLIKAKGGAPSDILSKDLAKPIDGRYGDRTAAAIASLVGETAPVKGITDEIAVKIVAALAGVEADQVKVGAPATTPKPAATATKPAATATKPAASSAKPAAGLYGPIQTTPTSHTSGKGTQFVIK